MNGIREKGILLTNAFLRTKKFCEHYEWLRKAAERMGAELLLMDNAQFLAEIWPMHQADVAPFSKSPSVFRDCEDIDFIIFWDKDISCGKMMEEYFGRQGVSIYNSIDAIAACDDKFETYFRLARWNRQHPDQEVALLPAIKAPMTYANVGYFKLDFLDAIENKLGYPMVIKECFGSFGEQVYLAENRKEAEERTKALAGKPFLYQKYHSYKSGRDVRMQVVGERVVAAMEPYSEQGDFRANITNGGSMRVYHPSERECEIARHAAKALGVDFAGVDLLFSEETGEADILCEVNSNAHFKNIHECTGVNVAEEIMQYIFSSI